MSGQAVEDNAVCEESLSDCRISVPVARRIDAICDQFEEACVAGQDRAIEQFLKKAEDISELESSVLFRELLELELHYRMRDEGDAAISRDAYNSRFPKYSNQIESAFRSAASTDGAVDDGLESTEIFKTPESGRRKGDEIVLGQLREYKLLQEIGHGAMGTVYKALHTKLDRIVALKLLSGQRTESPEAVARFEREIRAVAKLDHPNIVRATDAGEVDGEHFLVMELVKGVDLETVVRRVGQLFLADACEIVRQAAIGLQHAHEHGLVHRDIKPSNLMLTFSGTVKILDLGLARLRKEEPSDSEVTSSGQIVGTAHYMAPEQARHTHDVDIRADIYSLGCTLFKLLTRHAPFAGLKNSTPLDILIAHSEKPFPSVLARRPDVPQHLVQTLNRMVAKAPEDRPASPAEVATLLTSFCAENNLPLLAERARVDTRTDRVPEPPGEPEVAPLDETDVPLEQTESVPLMQPVIVDAEESEEERKPKGQRIRWVWLVVFVLLAGAAAFFFWKQPRAEDLLRQIDPQRDAVTGDWRLVDGILISPTTANACLRLPRAMPFELQLEMTAERQEGLTLIFVNVSEDAPFVVEFGATLVQAGDEKPGHTSDNTGETDTLFASWGDLANFAPRVITVSVTQKNIVVKRDGDVVVDRSGNFASLRGALPEFVPKRPGFYICTDRSEYRFSKIVYRATRRGVPANGG